MTDFETMRRVKWDGFPGEKVANKVISIREESDRRIANLIIPEPQPFRGILIGVPLGLLMWAGIFYAIRYVWVNS